MCNIIATVTLLIKGQNLPHFALPQSKFSLPAPPPPPCAPADAPAAHARILIPFFKLDWRHALTAVNLRNGPSSLSPTPGELVMRCHFCHVQGLYAESSISSSITRRSSASHNKQQRILPPVMLFALLTFMIPAPSSCALPSIYFNLESIDIQPLNDQESILRVCTEFRVAGITLGRGLAAAKLLFSPDGPSALSHTTQDAMCVDGVERGGRYRAQLMLVDDIDGSELPVRPPPPGASSKPFISSAAALAATSRVCRHVRDALRLARRGRNHFSLPRLHHFLRIF